MARQLRVEFPGAIYHVTCRMIGDAQLDHSRLFSEDPERERFLDRLSERVEEYNIRLYQFVLMTNHFHLVFETPEANCSKFMHALLTSYTVYYNLRHGRHGHLLDGRFKAKLVEGDDYLLALSRYVHLNPVKVGAIKDKPLAERIRHLRGYPWSSYPSYIGKARAYDFVTYGPVLAEMGRKPRERPRRYAEYVETGLAETDEEFAEALGLSPRSIGGEGFRAWVDELYEKLAGGDRVAEDVAFRQVCESLEPAVVLRRVAEGMGVEEPELYRRRRDSVLRAVAARCLMRYAGQTQREAAQILGAGSGSAISKQLSAHREAFAKGEPAKVLAAIERQLTDERKKRRTVSANSYLKG
jgi:REP element-mobilizing transposase RayT